MQFDVKGNKRKGVVIGRENGVKRRFLIKTSELAAYLYTDKNDPAQNKKVNNVIKREKK